MLESFALKSSITFFSASLDVAVHFGVSTMSSLFSGKKLDSDQCVSTFCENEFFFDFSRSI